MDLRRTAEAARRLFSVPRDNPELMRAQYAAFSKQVPLLYVILLTNTWAVALTHLHVAPVHLTIYIPVLFSIVGVGRIVSWWRSAKTPVDERRAARMLQGTNWLAVVLAVSFSAWGLALYPHGDAYGQGHVAFYMGITVIGCIFCLMHLRSAALTVTVIVNAVFVAFFVSTGNPAFIAIAVNAALVCIAMMVILWIYYRDFTHLIDSRRELMAKQRELVAKQAETQALSDANFRLANLDSLTGLPNRRNFFASLDARLAAADETGGVDRFAVGILDLDGFKPVNDIRGHVVGDSLLVEVSRRLREVCGEAVLLSRLGGDEFGLIVRDGDDGVAALGERICAAMRVPFALPEARVQISASLGFAMFPSSAAGADALFERADYALYHAKRSGPGEAVLFSGEHEAEIRRDAAIEQVLRCADLEGELSVVFQPIVDVERGRALGFEALARWRNADLGEVPPSVFVPAAERAGLIDRVTRILLEKTLAEAAGWPGEMRVAFNLSAKDIASADSVMGIAAAILKSGLDAGRIDLEITETAVMRDYAQARAAIDTLKALGVGISLDDFGTGYSSLTRLHTLPFDKIKIDRSFVTGIGDNPASYKIVKSVLSLSRDMDLACIVEGVETEDELRILRTLGGRLVQGYYFSRPMRGRDVPGYIARECGSAVAMPA